MNPKQIPHAMNEALAHHRAGRLVEAERVYREVLALNPSHPEALHLLALIAHASGKLEPAIDLAQRAARLDPSAPGYHYDLGTMLQSAGRLDDAIAAFRRALVLVPNSSTAWNNLGFALQSAGRMDQAIDAFRKAVEISPQYVAALNNLGILLGETGRTSEAIDVFRRALALNPEQSETHCNLGGALTEAGQIDEAIVSLRKAIELKPDFSSAHSNLLLTLHYRNGDDGPRMLEEHREWERIHAQPKSNQVRSHLNDRDSERKLRIGYLSGDFRAHSVAAFIEAVQEHHDRGPFEIFAYSNTVRTDAVTQRLTGFVSSWRNIVGLRDEQADDLIRGDKIDILIDLAGHSGHNRAALLALKPAPVQASWIGYPNTTGLQTVDYRITDADADPPGQTEQFHTEQLVRLPASFLCYRPSDEAPEIAPALDRPITFASFNLFAKLTPAMMQLWVRILQAVAGSRLLLKSAALEDEQVRAQTTEMFRSLGLPPDRLELLGWRRTIREHLHLYNRVDVALDPFPYHGTTTTCEALWMGVPVVTLAGRAHVSRVGASLLTSARLSDLVASDAEQYFQIATALAADAQRRAVLRRTLRERMRASALMDADTFTQNLESALREMWREWCR